MDEIYLYEENKFYDAVAKKIFLRKCEMKMISLLQTKTKVEKKNIFICI